MEITVLIDNTGYKLIGEKGLSLYIEHEGKSYLLDSGSSGDFLSNAKSLGVDLSYVDYAILSHAHYDHSNGFIKFFEINKDAKLYIQSCSAENCFSLKNHVMRYIGIKKGFLEQYKDRLLPIDGSYNLSEGVALIQEKKSKFFYNEIIRSSNHYLKEKGNFIKDEVLHEQSLVFDTPKGLIIFNSCSHYGINNIIPYVSKLYNGKKIYAYIGGLHLFRKGEKEILKIIKKLNTYNVEHLITGHCTGDLALELLEGEFNGKLTVIHSGLKIKL